MDKNNLKVAVTGGIGSGKSTAIKIISQLGFKTVSLDQVYKDLLQNQTFVENICAVTNTAPIIIDGKKSIDRKTIADKVFADKTALDALNAYTHGEILKQAFKQGGKGIVFYEVPLLFENGYQKFFDKVIVIKRDLSERIKSVCLRDGLSDNDVLKRMQNQYDYEKNDLSVHIIILNDGDLASFKNNIVKAIDQFEI